MERTSPAFPSPGSSPYLTNAKSFAHNSTSGNTSNTLAAVRCDLVGCRRSASGPSGPAKESSTPSPRVSAASAMTAFGRIGALYHQDASVVIPRATREKEGLRAGSWHHLSTFRTEILRSPQPTDIQLLPLHTGDHMSAGWNDDATRSSRSSSRLSNDRIHQERILIIEYRSRRSHRTDFCEADLP